MVSNTSKYKSFSEVGEAWATFLRKYYKKEIVELGNDYPNRRSLNIKFRDIDNFNSRLAEEIHSDPDTFMDPLTQELRNFDLETGVRLDKADIRIVELRKKIRIRDIRSEDIGTLISIEGLVLKATEVRPKIVEAVFECPFCGHIFSVGQNGRNFINPFECESCERKTPNFKLLQSKSKYADTQKIRLQDSPDELKGGELPQAIDINFADDLTGAVSPGNRLIVTGILRSYQRTTQFGKTPFFDIYLDGNSLEIMEEEFEEIRITEDDEKEIERLKGGSNIYEDLIGSIAPSIHGLKKIKEAIVLQLFGGVSKRMPDKALLRGNIHILIVGDPGIAKSMLLLYVTQLAPRGIYAAASSSSGVGLTAAAVRDSGFGDGRWTIEAGTLVLADKGIAAVDEFEKLKDEDQETLYEALEQQTVTIAKAGMNAKLNARCALLAAANPKHGRFDRYEAISNQIGIPPVLLSRFDLIFSMQDRPNEEKDRKMAKHITSAHLLGEIITRGEEKEGFEEFKPKIERDLLRKYISKAKKITPQLSDEAIEKFENFYIGLRSQGYENDSPVPVTARQLEALIRLGEARARTRLSDKVTAEDAECVIELVTHCLNAVSVDPETGKLDTDWITVGTTKTRRDRARKIEGIIKELEKEYDEEVPVDKIKDRAEEQGIEREKAEETINELKRDGNLFSPGGGVVRWIRH